MPFNPKLYPLLFALMLVLMAMATVANIGSLKRTTSITVEVPYGR